MAKIDTLYIPRFYDFYRCYADFEQERNVGVGAHNTEILSIWYYCVDCNTTFMVKHRRRPVFMYQYDYGENYVTCPSCGRHRVNIKSKRHIGMCLNKNDFPECWSYGFTKPYLPVKAKIETYETKYSIKVKGFFRTIKMSLTDDRKDVICNFENHSEIIEFNMKQRKTTFKKDGDAPVEIGFPNMWNKFLNDSLFGSISFDVFEDRKNAKEFEAEIKGFIANMRKACQRKWKEVNGYSLKRISTQAKSFEIGGYFLRQFHNIAFRMVFPDIPSIKNGEDMQKTVFGSSWDAMNDFESARKAKNSIQYLMDVTGLPNKPAIRRMLIKNPLNAMELKKVLDMTDNYDCNMAIYKMICEYKVPRTWAADEELDDMDRYAVYEFLNKVKTRYDANTVKNYVKRCVADSELFRTFQDTIRLARGAEITVFTKPLSKMHDELVEYWNRKEAEEQRLRAMERAEEEKFYKMLSQLRSCDAFSLNVPEEVKKRLIMQLNAGRGKFFLPETNQDLKYTSEIMHNCVRTYDFKILRQKCNIVYYTDDNGKLIACIEVKNDVVVQAKLCFNKPVHNDAEVNKIILEWAKAKHLKIDTRDISVEENAEEADITAA